MSLAYMDIAMRTVIRTQFFVRGWGSLDLIKRIQTFRRESLADPGSLQKDLDALYKPIEWSKKVDLGNGIESWEGRFRSPAADLIPGVLPPAAEESHFQLVVPRDRKNTDSLVIHYAGTGDHNFWRRRIMYAKPMAETHSIASIIFENPFYGLRRPRDQFRSSLRYMSDLFSMGVGLVTETHNILHWARDQGWHRQCLTGFSMGGIMACLSASAWPHPVSLVGCVTPVSASHVFTKGVLSNFCAWPVLISELKEHRHAIGDIVPNPIAEEIRRCLDSGSTEDEKQGAVLFMRHVMDELTDLNGYPRPAQPNAIIFLTASEDNYVPVEDTRTIKTAWPGIDFREHAGGHVSSHFANEMYRQAILESLDRLPSMELAA
eukprot:Clim_evm67s88 gene=Clim_evmTU67s88